MSVHTISKTVADFLAADYVVRTDPRAPEARAAYIHAARTIRATVGSPSLVRGLAAIVGYDPTRDGDVAAAALAVADGLSLKEAETRFLQV